MALPSDEAYEGLQSLHVSSGVRVFPERVESSTFPPDGTAACHFNAPHAATVVASRTSDVYVPRSARSAESRNTFPGFDVAKTMRPSRATPMVVTCSALAF